MLHTTTLLDWLTKTNPWLRKAELLPWIVYSCELWTTGTMPSSLFCSKTPLIHRIIVRCSSPHFSTKKLQYIWHRNMRSIRSILVSKQPSEPQQSHPLIRFQWKNVLKINKMRNEPCIFSLYTFWTSFVFFGRKVSILRKHFPWSLRDEPYVFRICRA